MNGDSEEADLIFISPDEVHCQLNKQISALIHVSDYSKKKLQSIIIAGICLGGILYWFWRRHGFYHFICVRAEICISG